MHFTSTQKRMLTICLSIYTSAYFCRLNLAAALESIASALSLSIPAAGFLQTVFALVYAMGQLVNGSMVDELNPARYVLVGIVGSAASNILMGASANYPMLIAACAMNAAFQSMLWTPIMRLIALYFRRSDERERVNVTLALTLVIGHFGAWAISGFMAKLVSWRFSFFAPAMLTLAVGLASALAFRGLDVTGQEKQVRAEQAGKPAASTMAVFTGTGFFLVLVACVLYGFIRDSVVTWTPTLLSHLSGTSSLTSTAFTLVLPVINIAGVVIGHTLRRRGANPHVVVVIMMLAAIVFCVPLMMQNSLLLTAVFLGCICAGMYGANTMLTGRIPLYYDRVGKTGLTAGLIDSLIYTGSAIAGVFGGALYDGMGASALYSSWIAAAIAAALLMGMAARMLRRYWSDPNL